MQAYTTFKLLRTSRRVPAVSYSDEHRKWLIALRDTRDNAAKALLYNREELSLALKAAAREEALLKEQHTAMAHAQTKLADYVEYCTPFDPKEKYMATCVRKDGGGYRLLIKGAPEQLKVTRQL